VTAPSATGFNAGSHLRGRLVPLGSRHSVRIYPRSTLIAAILIVILLALGVWTLTVGTIVLTWNEVVEALFGEGSDRNRLVVVGIRLPRWTSGVFVGACLGMSGSIFQSISRNILGSPDVIGFTTGAATGAIVEIVVRGGSGMSVAIAAFVSGLVTATVVYLLSRRGGVTGGFRLVLVGIGVGSVLASVNTLILARANIDVAFTAQQWLVGSLNAATWPQARLAMIGFVLLAPLVTLLARPATLIEMGDDLSQQLGVSVERVRRMLLFGGVGLAAIAVAVAGPIAFVALAAPQLVRRIVGTGGVHMLTSAFMGAALLVSADLAAQKLPFNVALPVGLMTGVIGGVYLLVLLTRVGDT